LGEAREQYQAIVDDSGAPQVLKDEAKWHLEQFEGIGEADMGGKSPPSTASMDEWWSYHAGGGTFAARVAGIISGAPRPDRGRGPTTGATTRPATIKKSGRRWRR